MYVILKTQFGGKSEPLALGDKIQDARGEMMKILLDLLDTDERLNYTQDSYTKVTVDDFAEPKFILEVVEVVNC